LLPDALTTHPVKSERFLMYAIIIFEMTDRHSIIFFLLLGAILASVVSNFVNKKSFYDLLKENYKQRALSAEKL
jgi:H+/Cl- antiporter ClcA